MAFRPSCLARHAFVVALWLASGACHETPGSQPLADAGADPSAAIESNDPAPSLEGSTIKVSLKSGATLTMPAVAAASDPSKAVPDGVERAHLFKLGHDKRLLMINELKPDTKTCDERLNEEWAKMEVAKNDPDEKRLAFRRLRVVEDLQVGGGRVLYLEALQKGFFQAEKRPYAAIASVTMCRDEVSIIMMFATDQPVLPRGTKAMMVAIAGSYAKP